MFGRKKDLPRVRPERSDDAHVSPDVYRSERLPPGQVETRKWPVLDASGTPDVDLATWRFEVDGLVERPFSLSLEEFRALPSARVVSDFHCVTRWSRLENLWEGVRTREIAERAGVDARAKFVVVHAYDNAWSTNMPIEDFLAEDAILAWSHDNEPLEPDHGGPVRLVVPRLYAWKSAKWVRAVDFVEHDSPGYWEVGGYHMRGDPWREQRYRRS